jgi:DHA1 family multidrug resistance protein-like MFS transporter
MSASNRNQILILSFILVVVTLGFGLVIPIFPFYIEELGAGGSKLGLLVATSALLEFVSAPLWGGVSDWIGRKPVPMLGMVGWGCIYTPVKIDAVQEGRKVTSPPK